VLVAVAVVVARPSTTATRWRSTFDSSSAGSGIIGTSSGSVAASAGFAGAPAASTGAATAAGPA
jgi:hypothetical protein